MKLRSRTVCRLGDGNQPQAQQAAAARTKFLFEVYPLSCLQKQLPFLPFREFHVQQVQEMPRYAPSLIVFATMQGLRWFVARLPRVRYKAGVVTSRS